MWPYAVAVAKRGTVDFKTVNEAIIERWSESALSYVKREAWSYYRQ